jgi:hypothetical protein
MLHRFQSLCLLSVMALQLILFLAPWQAVNGTRSPIITQTATKTNMNINITFKTDGTAQCLWTEALPLHELGRLEITRASHIEFNNTTQHWEVRDRKGKVRFIDRSRSACLKWEQQYLQAE